MKTKTPKHLIDLSQGLGMTLGEAIEHLANARRFFDKHKITVTYVRNYHEWRFSGFVGLTNKYGYLKCGLERFVDLLDTPSEVLKYFRG